uniref:Uncharacterized protein n=1 Tax=Acrobeloides nanus TaxID=290746 RepID=A0A914DN89_9BILA
MYITATKNIATPEDPYNNVVQENEPRQEENKEVVPSATIEHAKDFGKSEEETFLDIEKGYVPISSMLSSYEKKLEAKEIVKQQENGSHAKENKSPMKKVVSKLKKVGAFKKEEKLEEDDHEENEEDYGSNKEKLEEDDNEKGYDPNKAGLNEDQKMDNNETNMPKS